MISKSILISLFVLASQVAFAKTVTNKKDIAELLIQENPSLVQPTCLKDFFLNSDRMKALYAAGASIDKLSLNETEDYLKVRYELTSFYVIDIPQYGRNSAHEQKVDEGEMGCLKL